MEDIVRAKKFELVDDRGRLRAALGPGPEEGQTGMQFYGPSGEVRFELAVEDDGPTDIYLRDRHGEEIAGLSVGGETPLVSLTRTGAEGDSWGIALTGQQPETPETQRCSLILSEGGRPRLIVTLMGREAQPAIVMREGDDLVRVVP